MKISRIVNAVCQESRQMSFKILEFWMSFRNVKVKRHLIDQIFFIVKGNKRPGRKIG